MPRNISVSLRQSHAVPTISGVSSVAISTQRRCNGRGHQSLTEDKMTTTSAVCSYGGRWSKQMGKELIFVLYRMLTMIENLSYLKTPL